MPPAAPNQRSTRATFLLTNDSSLEESSTSTTPASNIRPTPWSEDPAAYLREGVAAMKLALAADATAYKAEQQEAGLTKSTTASSTMSANGAGRETTTTQGANLSRVSTMSGGGGAAQGASLSRVSTMSGGGGAEAERVLTRTSTLNRTSTLGGGDLERVPTIGGKEDGVEVKDFAEGKEPAKRSKGAKVARFLGVKGY